MNRIRGTRSIICVGALLSASILGACRSDQFPQRSTDGSDAPWAAGFQTGARHWQSSTDDDLVIRPLPGQSRYGEADLVGIAENVLLYQKENGGWPKNYDMLAILSDDQIEALKASKAQRNTTFDNGATYSQVHFLAHAFRETGGTRYRDGCLRGLEFILSAQYENGGWPQFYPDRSGYRRHITFNDGAMIGVMRLLRRITDGEADFQWVDAARREKVHEAYRRGLECILKCQIIEQGSRTGWCQQHDEKDFRPRGARTFELPALASEESADIVLFLMSVSAPDTAMIQAVSAAAHWFQKTALTGIRLRMVEASEEQYAYHTSRDDVVVVADPDAPRIWARFYELDTGRPLFCNRDGEPVYSLAEVERERRTGYAWYSYEPEEALRKYPDWARRWDPGGALLREGPGQ